MLWVTLGGAFEFLLFGRKDFGPSVNQQILISSELLLFFLEASCRVHKPMLETLFLNGIVFGGRHIIIVLDFSVCRSLMRAGFSILLC